MIMMITLAWLTNFVVSVVVVVSSSNLKKKNRKAARLCFLPKFFELLCEQLRPILIVQVI